MLYQLPQEIMVTGQQELGFVIFIRDGKIDKYSIQNIYKNPHNPQVALRVAMLADLLDVYGYSLNRIVFDVPIAPHKPKQSIDIVVYSDDALKKPFMAIIFSQVRSLKRSHKECACFITQSKKMGVEYAVYVYSGKRIIIAFSQSAQQSTKEIIIQDIPSCRQKVDTLFD